MKEEDDLHEDIRNIAYRYMFGGLGKKRSKDLKNFENYKVIEMDSSKTFFAKYFVPSPPSDQCVHVLTLMPILLQKSFKIFIQPPQFQKKYTYYMDNNI